MPPEPITRESALAFIREFDESIAQVATILILKSFPETDGKRPAFLGIDKARFRKAIRPGDVLGALTGDAGFTREQVGKITVTDQTTYVAVVRAISREAVRKLSAGKVKGKAVKVRAL